MPDPPEHTYVLHERSLIKNRCKELLEGSDDERRIFLMMEAVLASSPLVLGTLITHMELAGYLLENMVGMTDRTGRSLLTVAVRMRSLEMVMMLAEKNSGGVNLADKTGDAPLHVAVRLGAADIVQVLLERETCNPNIVNRQGQAPLHLAVTHHHLHCLHLLIKHQDIKINQSNLFTRTPSPLVLAVHHGQVGAVRALLHHPDIILDCQDNTGTSIAEIAHSQPSGEVLRLLLGAGVQAHRLEAVVPHFRGEDWLARRVGWQELKNTPLSLMWISCMVVREMLVNLYYPRSIFPVVDMMVMAGDIARGVGQLITCQ